MQPPHLRVLYTVHAFFQFNGVCIMKICKGMNVICTEKKKFSVYMKIIFLTPLADLFTCFRQNAVFFSLGNKTILCNFS